MRDKVALLGLLVLAGCAANPAIGAARRGDRAELKAAILAREKTGNLSNGDAADIAKAVVEHDLAQAKPDEALDRVREVVACGHELDGVLRERMKVHDTAGAVAALARVEAGGLDDGDAREYLGDADERWRAVGARGLVREKDRDARAHALVDTSPYVRREATRAAKAAADPADLGALLDAARVDPEPLVRTEAVRAIAALPSLPGANVSGRLRDLFAAADGPLREDIAVAWAAPSLYGSGGRDQLLLVLAQTHGQSALEASAAVLRLPPASGPRDVDDLAVAQLVGAIKEGSRRDRLHALAVARPERSPDILAAIDKAAEDDDFEVRVAALARLTERADRRGKAVQALETFAGEPNPLRVRALLALGSAGDMRVQKWMEEVLASADPNERLAAAAALVALGRSSRAAPLLADEDPSVRMRAACTLLMAARIKG